MILGKHKEAIEDYDKAIELDPKNAVAYNKDKQQAVNNVLGQVSVYKYQEVFKTMLDQDKKRFRGLRNITVALIAIFILISIEILPGISLISLLRSCFDLPYDFLMSLLGFDLQYHCAESIIKSPTKDIDLKEYLPLFIFISSLLYILTNQTINAFKQMKISENRRGMVDFFNEVQKRENDENIRIEMIKQIIPSIAHRIDDRGASNITNKFNAHGN